MKHRYTYKVNRFKIVYVRGSRPLLNSRGKSIGYSHFSYPLVANFSQSHNAYRSVPVVGIAKVVMFILVLFMFASALYGRDTTISFSSFFQSLEHVPAIDMSKVFTFTESLRLNLSGLPPITKFWGGVFNTFVAPILSFLIFINVCIYQLLAFVGFFIYFCVYGVYVL